jgi:acetyltransferase-like isoleucine patch superfamily enzyme
MIDELKNELKALRLEIYKKYNRHISIQDIMSDRWETAKFYGFGEGTSCYNNVLILGDVDIGKNCWIGPNVVLDGTGGLVIGDNVDISAGVQIYTHHTVSRAISHGADKVESKPTTIGSGVYIGPNSILQMGIEIGNESVIGALSFVNKDVPSKSSFYSKQP